LVARQVRCQRAEQGNRRFAFAAEIDQGEGEEGGCGIAGNGIRPAFAAFTKDRDRLIDLADVAQGAGELDQRLGAPGFVEIAGERLPVERFGIVLTTRRIVGRGELVERRRIAGWAFGRSPRSSRRQCRRPGRVPASRCR
jgi:hypothetical protein